MLHTLTDEDGNNYNVELEIRNIVGKERLVAIWDDGADIFFIDLKHDLIDIRLT